MKIINFRSPPQRSHGRKRYCTQSVIAEETFPTNHDHIPPPAKKALLIGIMYKSEAANENDIRELRGPHKDICDMKKLLTELYDYHPDDITVMMDSHECSKSKTPTRANILRQVKMLVQDARPGDHFFFHYSGHIAQVENRNNSEEDGMDECLVPIDGVSAMIMDNELRTQLVDSLPIGSQLIAIFDSCHSASMLDLAHHRCNRVYVPWISKGRRKSATMWNRNIRKHGMHIQTRNFYHSRRTSPSAVRSRRTSIEFGSPLVPLGPTISRRGSSDTDASNSDIRAPRRPLRISTSVVQLKLQSSRPPSVAPSPTPAASRGATPPVSRAASLISRQPNRENSFWPLDLEEGEEPMRCDSPTAMYPCEGNCRDSPENPLEKEQADVISLSSCKDSQVSWEDAFGTSMTQILVGILKKNPTPTFQDLLTSVSHDLHKLTFLLHEQAQKYRKEIKIYRKYQEEQLEVNPPQHRNNTATTCPLKKKERRGKKVKAASEGQALDSPLNMDNFQDPQLSSHLPLDMNAQLRI